MTFFPEPLKPSKQTQDKPIIVNPIEADKKSQENKSEGKIFHTYPPLCIAMFLIPLKKILTLLIPQHKKDLTSSFQEELAHDLHTLHHLLEKLKQLDQSQNTTFVQEFSKLWHHLLQQMQTQVQTQVQVKNQESCKEMNQLKKLIAEMDHFPQNAEHKLGYYLFECAKKTWIPMPFRDILNTLHTDYQANKKESDLEKWTSLLKEMGL